MLEARTNTTRETVMARRLRFRGTDSRQGGCPALHEDMETGEIIVQGAPLNDALDLEQLQHFSPGESAVVVPRELLVNWGPKEIDRVPEIIDQGSSASSSKPSNTRHGTSKPAADTPRTKRATTTRSSWTRAP